MNKRELIDAMAAETGMTKKDCGVALKAFMTTVENALRTGNKVQLTGFGAFEVKVRGERTARNPRTKETVTIPATKAPVFKAGKCLKDAVHE